MFRYKILIGIIVFVAVGFFGFAFLYPVQAQPASFVKGVIFDSEIDSVSKYKESLILYFDSEKDWSAQKKTGTYNQPEIAGVSGILVDINTGNILFEKDSEEKRPIASLVKIMTAVVAIEHARADDKFYISSKAGTIGENSMGVDAGETYLLEELLYGLFLHSGNDAAYAIAENVAGNSERFTEWMNIKAEELGLENTYFADPSGLNNNSYSTPADLVKLTKYALKFDVIKKVGSTLEMELTGENHKYIYLYNQTNLLSTYPGVKGLKTGYTDEAGLCLVTYAENDGQEVVGVVLDSIDRKGDMILMLDHGFSTLGVSVVHNLL